MREISSAFGLPLEMIETELTELITTGQIKAKIDSYQKRLYARKQNPQLDAYKKAAQVGEQFIRDTEDMLLKINLMKNNQIFDIKDRFSLNTMMNEVWSLLDNSQSDRQLLGKNEKFKTLFPLLFC